MTNVENTSTVPKHFHQRHLIWLRFSLVGNNFQEFIEGYRKARVVTGDTSSQFCCLEHPALLQNNCFFYYYYLFNLEVETKTFNDGLELSDVEDSILISVKQLGNEWIRTSRRLGQCQNVTHLKQALQFLKFIFQDAKLLLSKYVMFNSPKVRQITYKINPDNVFDPIIPSFGRSSLDMRLFILWSALVQGLSQDINVKPSHYLFVIFSSPVSVCVVWDFLPVRGREEGGHETACDTPVTS